MGMLLAAWYFYNFCQFLHFYAYCSRCWGKNFRTRADEHTQSLKHVKLLSFIFFKKQTKPDKNTHFYPANRFHGDFKNVPLLQTATHLSALASLRETDKQTDRQTMNKSEIWIPSSGGCRLFLRRRQLPEWMCWPIILQIFCRKLHENERIWTPKGRASLTPLWIRQCLRIRIYFLPNQNFGLKLRFAPVNGTWGVLVLLKFYWAPDIVKFVLGRFSHFNIAIAYSNSTFCGAWTPSFCEFTQNFSKTSTPLKCR